MKRSRLAALACAVAVLAMPVLACPSASAHNALISSTPRAGEQVATAPAVIELAFAEPVVDLGTAVVVSGPAGEVQSGALSVSGQTVRQPLQPRAPAGDYTVTWRVVSADGHPVSGTFNFHADAAGTGAPTPVDGDPAGNDPAGNELGASGWLWLVLGAAVIATLGVLVAQRTRQRRSRIS